MGTRGRKSAVELAIAPVVVIDPRPVAPDELTDEQAEIWERTVAGLPGSFFPAETHGLLAQYCRHVVSARRIAQALAKLETGDDFDSAFWLELLKAQQRETAAIKATAASLRISNQSRYGARAAATASVPKGPRPWEC